MKQTHPPLSFTWKLFAPSGTLYPFELAMVWISPKDNPGCNLVQNVVGAPERNDGKKFSAIAKPMPMKNKAINARHPHLRSPIED